MTCILVRLELMRAEKAHRCRRPSWPCERSDPDGSHGLRPRGGGMTATVPGHGHLTHHALSHLPPDRSRHAHVVLTERWNLDNWLPPRRRQTSGTLEQPYLRHCRSKARLDLQTLPLTDTDVTGS
jgi:hypothetical protein